MLRKKRGMSYKQKRLTYATQPFLQQKQIKLSEPINSPKLSEQKKTFQETQPTHNFPHSIILRQPPKIRNSLRAVKIPLPRLLRQNARLHPQLPAPLHRILRLPRPIKPSPPDLETRHLSLGVHHEPLLVHGRVLRRVGIGVVALAGARVGRARGREHLGRGVACVHGAGPAAADVDVVEVGGAVRVCLGPFAAHGWAEAGEGVSEMMDYGAVTKRRTQLQYWCWLSFGLASPSTRTRLCSGDSWQSGLC